MLNLTQATTLLATAYGVPDRPLQTVRKRLISDGALPASVGRSIPAAFPHRLALLVLGLGSTNTDRITALADLRRFNIMPGDIPDAYTLADALTFSIKGLMENPDTGLDMHLIMTLDNSPWAIMQSHGRTLMHFGETRPQTGFIQTNKSISLMPLTAYVDAAREVLPPFPVTR